jgi:hypothetical protein
MSSGSREILRRVAEITKGVTPPNPIWTSVPFTDTSLDAATTKEDSATKLASRLSQRGSITAVDYTGDINAEFRFGFFDQEISAVAYNDWVPDSPVDDSDTLTFGGELVKTFTYVRGYTDINNYHTFRGVHVNTFNLSIPETGFVTATFGLIGMGRTPSDTAPAGQVTTPTLTDPFSSVSITDVKIDGVSTVGVSCITTFEFNWDNTAQTQRCLGGGLNIGNIIATLANGTGSYTQAWSTDATDEYEKQFTNTLISLEVEMTDGAGNVYTLKLPKIEITSALPSGSNEDLLQATFDYRVVEEAPTLTRTPTP